MKNLKTVLLMIFASSLLFNCKSEKKVQDFKAITDAYFNDKNELDPLGATQNGQSQFNDKLVFEMTDSHRKKQAAFYDKYENEMATIDTTSLSAEEKNSYEIIKWEVSIGKDLLKYDTNLMPIQQFWGTNLTLGQFAGGTSAQPFKTEKDYRNFLKRMDLYAVWMDSAMVYMKKGIDKGVVLPKVLTAKVIPQFESMVTPNVEDNLFYSSLKLFPKGITSEQQNALKKEYAAVIKEKLEPQFKKMTAFLKDEYLPASRSTSGIGSLPNGQELYKVYTKLWTTTDKTPEEIHELGLSEVARIKDEMEKVKGQVGFKGTINEFFEHVRTKPELMNFKKPEDVIANFERIYNVIKPNVDKLFSLQPKCPFEIKRTEAFREASASAEYNQGSADGKRPGVFYVPIPDVKHITATAMKIYSYMKPFRVIIFKFHCNKKTKNCLISENSIGSVLMAKAGHYILKV